MFDFIRAHNKLMQLLLLIFIAPAFVLLGVSGYSTSTEAEALAVVGDHAITQQEFDQVKRNQIEQARRQAPENFDPAQLDTPVANRQILQAIINDYLLQQAVAEQYLTASDEALQADILQNGMFQKDGKFDKDAYLDGLAARGLSASQYEANLRFRIAMSQVLDPVILGAFNSKVIAEQIDNAQLSGKSVRSKTIPLTKYLAEATVEDAEIADYYEKNKSNYVTPESVDVEYLVLSPDTVKEGIEVSDSDVASYYEQNKARFTEVEERRASHILISVDDKTTDDEARKKAEDILAKLNADPEQFAALAKEFSTDPGSAAQGGDLGFFTRGLMVPEFDQSVFSQSQDQLSGLVKTQFGYHIIKVTDIKGGEIKPLDAVKQQIMDEIRGQKLTIKMAEAQEVFAEKVFEGGQSFADVEKALDLKAETVTGLVRSGENAQGVLSDKALLAEIFSDDSIKNRNNTKAITVGESLVSARVISHSPATPKPLEAVKADVREQVKNNKASLAALKDADALAERIQKEGNESADLATFTEVKTVSALTSGGLPPLAAQSVLDVSAADLPKAKVVGLGDQGYLVAWVVEPVTADAVKAKAEPQLVNAYDSIATRAFNESLALAARDALSKRLKVEIRANFNEPQ